jgi:hypothetical protein
MVSRVSSAALDLRTTTASILSLVQGAHIVNFSIRSIGVVALFVVTPRVAAASHLNPVVGPHNIVASYSEESSAASPAATAEAELKPKIKARIEAEPDLRDSNITVTTAGNVVTLKGTVSSAASRVKAVEITRATEGVTKVVNKLTITTKK